MSAKDPSNDVERAVLEHAAGLIALDEVGRGAIAGPVVVGAVRFEQAQLSRSAPPGLRDSKLVPESRRAALADATRSWVADAATGWASALEVDELGIMRALGLAASRAILALSVTGATGQVPVLLDGNYDYVSAVHPEPLQVRTIVKGDRDCVSLSAASIVAKVERDDFMCTLHTQHPEYGWERNKGYASATHRQAIDRLGLTDYHRRSWTIAAAPTLF